MTLFDNPPRSKIKKIHFIGIGGSGMSGIAEVLVNLGYEISGSDIQSNTATEKLEKLGCSISYKHLAANVLGKQAVVGPIKAKELYHVFKVFTRYKKGSQKDFFGCYDEIYQRLYKRSVAEKSTHILDSLKQSVNIYINPVYQQK